MKKKVESVNAKMAGKRIRVLVADDHDVVAEGVEGILNEEEDIIVLSPALRSGDELFDRIRSAQPDVLLLDVKMPRFDMLTALGQLGSLFPQLRVMIVTAQQDPQLVKAAAEKGAAGYILKEEALSSLLPMAVREIYRGHLWFSPRASEYLIQNQTADTDLSDYQRDVLRLMVKGDTPEVIAQALQRSINAIYSAQRHIREKLGVETNEQAVIIAMRDRLVSLNFDENSTNG